MLGPPNIGGLAVARCLVIALVAAIQPIAPHRSMPTEKVGGHNSQSFSEWREPVPSEKLLKSELIQIVCISSRDNVLEVGVTFHPGLFVQTQILLPAVFPAKERRSLSFNMFQLCHQLAPG